MKRQDPSPAPEPGASQDLPLPVVVDSTVHFTLRTGEKLSVELEETGFGLYGYSLKVRCDRQLLLMPGVGSNAVSIRTVRSLVAEREASAAVVASRRLNVQD